MNRADAVLVIGGAGEVGEGIVEALLEDGQEVIAAGRTSASLERLAKRLAHFPTLRTLVGSVAGMTEAAQLADAAGPLRVVVVAVNAHRKPVRLTSLSPEALAALLHADLLSHFSAIRTFLPRLPHGGCLIGIGGGAADFILEEGVHLSMAQAALRQMYRGIAQEQAADGAAVRELIVASVVAGRKHGDADPLWVTPLEIGRRIAEMVAAPASFPATVWRIARRGASGQPEFGPEPAAAARALPL